MYAFLWSWQRLTSSSAQQNRYKKKSSHENTQRGGLSWVTRPLFWERAVVFKWIFSLSLQEPQEGRHLYSWYLEKLQFKFLEIVLSIKTTIFIFKCLMLKFSLLSKCTYTLKTLAYSLVQYHYQHTVCTLYRGHSNMTNNGITNNKLSCKVIIQKRILLMFTFPIMFDLDCITLVSV